MSYVLDYVFPQKAKYIGEAKDNFVKQKADNISTYKNAVMLPARRIEGDNSTSNGRGGLIDSYGNYVKASSTKSRICGKYNYSDCDFIDKKSVYCGYLYKIWGHFLTEVVSRLWYALKNDDSVDYYVFLGDYGGDTSLQGNYLEFMKMLGIEDKVIIINKPTKFATVLLPDEGFVYGEYYSDEFVKMYKFINSKGLSQYTGPKYDKVFFSKIRCEISIKSNLNEDFLDKFFKKNGYQIFYPEKLSLVETIGIMQNAKFFCAHSSSLAHNQLFGHSNQTMISIEKQAFYNPYQVFITKITGCKCVFIDACRSIFTVGSAGPFIFDYTNHLDRYVKDNNMIPGKPMSNFKFRKILKRYFSYYFDFNNTLPPDYMFRQPVVDMTREAYNDTVKNKIFRMSLYQRLIVKFKQIKLRIINR